ncbi:hypothetical protein Maes01_02053 [Microbulbifer aestuariivivens]|uniref:Uncharacterized protein n=2 Tax=Microbulbifer aestuariivivens TaxID=1908308 RepID=A0ABP9WQK1_9GAMM
MPDPAEKLTVDFFSPADCLVDIFSRALSYSQNIHVKAAGLGSLTFSGSSRRFLADTQDLADFLRQPPQRVQVSVLSSKTDLLAENPAARDAEELLWQAAFYGSNGRLLQGCHWSDVVQLKRWPNLTRLPTTSNAFRILAIFYQHPTSVYLASRLLKIPAAEVYQVYSAAHAAGLTRAVNREISEPQLKPHRQRALLSSLLERLSIR